MARKGKASEMSPTPATIAASKEDTVEEEAVPTGPCHFFRLPAELRNRVYELALNMDSVNNCEAEVNLLTAQPPSKGLLSTCRQIHNEVKSMYKTTYRSFWRDTRFYIDELHLKELHDLDAFEQKDLAHINHLWMGGVVMWSATTPSERTFRWVPDAQVWKNENPATPHALRYIWYGFSPYRYDDQNSVNLHHWLAPASVKTKREAETELRDARLFKQKVPIKDQIRRLRKWLQERPQAVAR